MISVLICGVILTGCGGSSGSGGSKLKNNKYLGLLPSIYANYNADKKAMEEKWHKKYESTKDLKKLMKFGEEQTKEEKALKEKFEADCIAERDKNAGNEIPVIFSKALLDSGDLFYDVEPLKLYFVSNMATLPAVNFSFTAKHDLELPARINLYTQNKEYVAYYRAVASDGSGLTYPDKVVLLYEETKPKSIAAGTALKTNDMSNVYSSTCTLINAREPEKWIDFAGIEFVTKSEYEEICNNFGK